MSAPAHSLSLIPLFELRLQIGYERALHTDEAPSGARSSYPVIGGEFWGDRLRGTVEATGMDWVRWRSDDAMEIDMRTMLRTDDGALIAMSYAGLALLDPVQGRDGVRDFGAGTAAASAASDPTHVPDTSAEQPFARTTPRFETGAPAYAWLNRVIAVAKGQRTPHGPHYSVFTVE